MAAAVAAASNSLQTGDRRCIHTARTVAVAGAAEDAGTCRTRCTAVSGHVRGGVTRME